MSKLASIQQIESLKPIEGADRIEVAQVLGYQTVVQKGAFKPGDLCIWHEPDTILPDKPEYAFLSKRHFRLKVCKLKGQISQGLAMPLNGYSGNVGDDVTDLVGITKYEKPVPACLSGQVKGYFPAFIPKTDEPNLRSYPEAIEELRRYQLAVTVKIDGSSGTFYKANGKFGVCSRNCELVESDNNAFWRVARKYGIESQLSDGMAIQGEVYGEGVQGNPAGIKGVDLAVFNVFDILLQRYMPYELANSFCAHRKLPQVRSVCQLFQQDLTVDGLVQLAAQQEYAPGIPAEGIVIRPIAECLSFTLPSKRLSVKVINELYALKHGE